MKLSKKKIKNNKDIEQEQKISNENAVVNTPDAVDNSNEIKAKPARRRSIFMNILNILMTVAFIFLTVISLKKMQPGTLPFYVTIAVIAVYGIMIIATTIVAIVNRNKANDTIRQMSVAAKTINISRGIMMKIILLMNIAVSIMFVIENFNDNNLGKYFSLGVLIFSLLMAVYSIFRKIKKVRKTIKKEQKRKQKLEKKIVASQAKQKSAKKPNKIATDKQVSSNCTQIENTNNKQSQNIFNNKE